MEPPIGILILLALGEIDSKLLVPISGVIVACIGFLTIPLSLSNWDGYFELTFIFLSEGEDEMSFLSVGGASSTAAL